MKTCPQQPLPHSIYRGPLPTMNDPYTSRLSDPHGSQRLYPPDSTMSYQTQAHNGPPPSDYQARNLPGDSRLPPDYPPGANAQSGAVNLPLIPGIQPASNDLESRSSVENGKRYELVVEQQPLRARMCGFGDKDRRPITPPPCVRLKITDAASGEEMDYNDVEYAMFVLSVDLWSANGREEVNLVRHSSATPPTLASSIASSYPPLGQTQLAPGPFLRSEPEMPFNPYPGPPQVNSGHLPQPATGQPYYQHDHYGPPLHSKYAHQMGYARPPQQTFYPGAPAMSMGYGPPHQQTTSQYGLGAPRPFPQHEMGASRGPVANPSPQGMFTRNLIGSLASSAFKLTNTQGQAGLWFVLQDLSVRTEGSFRLRFSFVNVGLPIVPGNPNGTVSGMQVNTSRAPMLATVFSDIFQVYSAKRFPGVVESTDLSKMFATQGIKIPIRKEGNGKTDKDKDDDDE